VLVDGLWIIMIGEYGLVGLSALLGMVLIPAFILWKRIPTRSWPDPACAAPVALVVITAMYMVDGLFNATFNPVACLAVGAIASIGTAAKLAFVRNRASAYVYQPQGFPVIASAKDIPFVSAYRS
jgi:O-antigen ligase